MQKFKLPAFLAAIYIFAAAICGSLPVSAKEFTAENMLEPSAELKFTDIPVPAGFSPLVKDSYSFENAGIRVGILKYRGKANIEQVANFYKEQMLIYNWTLLNAIEHGEQILNFDRGNETCIINLRAKGNNVSITISLGPKSQQTPPPPPKKAAKEQGKL